MDQSSSSTVKFCLKSPEKLSLKLRRQRSVDDLRSTSRRKSFREKHSLNIRRVRSFDHHMRTSRRAKVLYKPKSKMKIVMVTLSSPEKTPSPDIFSGFDIDVKGSNFKKLCSPKNCEKSIKLFFDTSEEPINADVIVKENEKEVERIPVNELLNIQDDQPKRLYGKQINLTASQPEWSPDIRIYDHDSGYLCERESMFLQKRKMYIQTALRKLFDEDEEIQSQSSVPHIALMGSGGGYRAMVAMSGIVNALYDEKLLDYILYTSVLSGSSWYIATLYSHPDWPNIDPRKVQKKIKADISKNPKTLSNLFYYGWDYFKTKKVYRQEWNFTTHVFGPMLGQALISDRMKTRWSEQADKMSEGTVPLPLLAAIHAKDKGNAKTFHEWVEFSPYEVAIPKYGASIDMKLLGSEFTKGVLTRKNKELPLYEIMSICGSAFTLTLEELHNKDSTNYKPHKSGMSTTKVLDHNNKEDYDQLDGIGADFETIDNNCMQPSHEISWDVLDGVFNTTTKGFDADEHSNNATTTKPQHFITTDNSGILPTNDVFDGPFGCFSQNSDSHTLTSCIRSGTDVFDVCHDDSQAGYHNNESDVFEQSNKKQGEDDCTHTANNNDLPEDVLKDLDDSFTTICQILEDEEPSFEKNEENQQFTKGRREGGSMSSTGDDDCFYVHQADNDNGEDEIDGFVPECIKNTVKGTFKKRWVVNDRRDRAAFVNNFMRNVSFDEPDSPYKTTKNALFENYLKTGLEKLCLIDAGLAFNSPYPLLFQPGRDIDLILSFDFTDRKKDSNNPFKTLLTAEQWARTHDVKFPNIAKTVEKYNGKDIQELYIFEDELDPECPIIMHFVLVNNDFRKYKKPGQTRDKNEQKFADFNIYDDQSTFHCENFHYSKANFERLSQLSEFIVLNNVERIKDCIRVSTRKKIQRLQSRSRTRQRHPTT